MSIFRSMITQTIILYFHKQKLIKNSKISFANAFLKQNASKLNEIQMQIHKPEEVKIKFY